jgi:hypothetical protein
MGKIDSGYLRKVFSRHVAVDSVSNRDEYNKYFLGGKAAGAEGQ